MVMDAEEAEEERLIGECLAILGKPLPEVLAGHAAYCKRAKQALNEEQASVDPMRRTALPPLTRSEYIMYSAIRCKRHFLFEHVQLSFDILRQFGVDAILRERWMERAPLLFPLCLRQRPQLVFEALRTVPSASDVLFEEHVSELTFIAYVEALRRRWSEAETDHRALLESLDLVQSSPAPNGPATVASSPSSSAEPPTPPGDEDDGGGGRDIVVAEQCAVEPPHLSLKERVMVVVPALSLLSSALNSTCTALVTDAHLFIHRKSSKRIDSYELAKLVRVTSARQGFFKSQFSLALEFSSSRARETKTVDLGFGFTSASETQRNAIALFMKDLLKALSLCRSLNSPIIERLVLHNCIDDVLRAQAVRDCTAGTIEAMKALLFLSNAVPAARTAYVQQLVRDVEAVNSSSGVLGALFRRRQSCALSNPMSDPRMVELLERPTETKRPTEKLDFGKLGDNAKLLLLQTRPAKLLQHFHARLLLLVFAYEDWLRYVPALAFLCNCILLLLLHECPDTVSRWFDVHLQAMEEAKMRKQRTTSNGPMNDDEMEEESSGVGLIGRLKSTVEGYRDAIARASRALESLQNTMARCNHNILKLKGLYTWLSPRRTKQFMVASACAFLIFLVLPFRLIFAAFVLQHFSAHFRTKSGKFKRYVASIPAAKAPELTKDKHE